MALPLKPNKGIVNSYIKKWQTLENYKLQEESLSLLFNKYCPDNKKIEPVLLKVSALNDFYSTKIYDTYSVAKHILNCKIDKDIKKNCKKVVNKIALVKIKDKQINFYSFASKYCCHHNPENYPIYDSYVDKMLRHFMKVDNFDKFNKADLKNYERFLDIINNFKKHYKLENYSLRQIDIYLWQAGKEYFPNNYKK